MMGCGTGIGGALMEDLIYPRLWLVENQQDKKKEDIDDDDEPDHDINRLFPKKTKRSVSKLSQKGTPEWLAMSVGVFFVGALFTIASYQVYSGNFSKQLSHLSVNNDEENIVKDPVHDEPEQLLYNNFRLPGSVVPVSYILYLNVSVQKKKYNGVMKIEITCKRKTSEVILHSIHHNIGKVTVKSAVKHENVPVVNMFRNKKNSMLILSLNESLKAGSTYHLIIGFGAHLTNEVSNGIYLSAYKDGKGNSRKMVSTDFEPIGSRAAWPCFDEPAMKATWKIIIHPQEKGYHALSNMQIEKIVQVAGGTREIFFKTTPKMSTYLVSTVVTEYVYRKGTSQRGVKVRVYAPIGRLEEAAPALRYAMFAVDYYSKAFGIKYMLPKLDLYPVTKISSAADETWGNIVFEETSLLLNNMTSSQYSYYSTCSTVCHEISHQWFGDLVTMEWWNDLWLKESLAEYLEMLPVAKLYPSWDIGTSSYTQAIAAFAYDASKFTHPVGIKKALDVKVLTNSYDLITYEKGAALINMLAKFIGNNNFLHGLKIYLNRYSYGTANITQLWDALSEASKPINIDEFMNTWIFSSGYPVVTAKRVGDSVVVEQKKFLFKSPNEDATKNADSTIWHIPMHIGLCGKVSEYLLKTKTGTLMLNSQCHSTKVYRVNYGSSGFYHVNYIDDNWSKLLQIMTKKHDVLPSIDRSGILYDVYHLARFNHVNVSLALDFTQYLSTEREPLAWRNGLRILHDIRRVFYTKLKKCVDNYIVERIGPVVNYLNSFKPHNHKQISLLHIMLNEAISINKADDLEPLMVDMEHRFLEWLVCNNTIKLPVNVRSQILNAGIVRGGVSEFEQLNKTRMKANSVEEKQQYLLALTFSKDTELLKRIVMEAEWKLDITGLRYLCLHKDGRPLAWEAVKRNWKAIHYKYERDTGYVSALISQCLGSGTTKKELSEAQHFLDSTELGRFKVYVERSIEHISRSIDLARHENEITEWFRKHGNGCAKPKPRKMSEKADDDADDDADVVDDDE